MFFFLFYFFKYPRSKLYKAMVIPSVVLSMSVCTMQYADCARVRPRVCVFVFVFVFVIERKKNKTPLVRLLRYRHGFLFVRSFSLNRLPRLFCIFCCWWCRYRLLERVERAIVQTTLGIVVVVVVSVDSTCRQANDLLQ